MEILRSFLAQNDMNGVGGNLGYNSKPYLLRKENEAL